MRRRFEIANELRDSAEINKDFAFYTKYLEALIPAVVSILSEEKSIVFFRDTIDNVSSPKALCSFGKGALPRSIPVLTYQRFRLTLLNFLARLPKTEPFRQHEAAVMEMAAKLLRLDNEDNALVCIKIMIDAFRNHRVCPACPEARLQQTS